MILDKLLSPKERLDKLIEYWNTLDKMPAEIANIEASILIKQMEDIKKENRSAFLNNETPMKNYNNLLL
jgi:hypothetical protein